MNESIKSKIRTVPDWPKQGIMFRDITTLIKDKDGIKEVIDTFYERYKNKKIDAIAGIEARGFIFGGALAYKLGLGFIPIRKKGKLPSKVARQSYSLEYGTDEIEMHVDAIKKGDRIVLIDDLVATGGTASAACQLIEKLGGVIVECAFIVDLPDLKGKDKLKPRNVYCLVEFEGD